MWFYAFSIKIDVENDVKWRQNKTNKIVGIEWPLESIKLAIKPYKSGIVVVYSPNNGDFRRFQSKPTKIDVENDVENDVKLKKITS